jgi:hypothetical protein
LAPPDYISGMSKFPRTPKNSVKVRRLPEKGAEITLKATVTRTGRNTYGTADTITVRIDGYSVPVTLPANAVLGEG